MGPLMFQTALRRPEIFLPLLFQVDQCPLPPAEGKMLDTGHREIIFFHQPILWQLTPAGIASSTVTV